MIYNDRNEQVIATLHPTVAALVRQWLSKLQTAKREVILTSGRRTPQEQEHLWESGRKYPGPIVTNAHGVPVPESFHCFGVAVDFCPVDKAGHALYGSPTLFWTY